MIQTLLSLILTHRSKLLWAPILLGLFYLVCLPFYNVFLHPLRNYPGPKLWVASRVFYARSALSGGSHKEILELHKHYGDVVRIAPNALSFVSPEAWHEIMGHRKRGQQENGKDPLHFTHGPNSIIAADRETHRRSRKILSQGFSTQSMLDQQPIIMSYVDLLIQRLHENCDSGRQPVEVTSWYNWPTFDIIGDLAFGEPFGCLENSEYDPWVALIFQRLRGISVRQILAHFPFGLKLLTYFMSEATKRGFLNHRRITREKVDKRIAQSDSRPDFIDAMTKTIDGQTMSHGEIIENAALLSIAGSETSAAALCAVTYFLATEPSILSKVTDEVRFSLPRESQIDITSVGNLTYMSAVLKEALRLFPPTPNAMPRLTPPGGDTIFGQYIPGDNFTQAESFKPERWLDNPQFKDDVKDAFQPFSFGPRDYIGKNLAYAEMRLILAKILWNFDLRIHPNSKDWIKGTEAYFLWEKPKMYVYLTPRAKY